MNLRILAAIAALLITTATDAGSRRPSWARVDGCRDTRAMVLAKQCASVTWDARGCHITQATCKDVYEDAVIATDTAAQSIQVDHVFPYNQALQRRTWTAAEMRRFFNDTGNLLAVRARTNERKSDKMPQEWCPATRGGRRVAAARFTYAATTYHLRVSAAEWAGVEAWRRGECSPGARVLGGAR